MKRITARVLFLCSNQEEISLNVNSLGASSSGNIPFISIEDLKAKLAEPSVVVLDVRIPKHIAASRFKVKGAVWVNPKEFDRWVHNFSRDATYVLY